MVKRGGGSCAFLGGTFGNRRPERAWNGMWRITGLWLLGAMSWPSGSRSLDLRPTDQLRIC